jgi:lysozyme
MIINFNGKTYGFDTKAQSGGQWRIVGKNGNFGQFAPKALQERFGKPVTLNTTTAKAMEEPAQSRSAAAPARSRSLAERYASSGSLMGAVGKHIVGDKASSRIQKIKEAFQPENIVYKLTGSRLLGTIAAKATGASQSRIDKVSGKAPTNKMSGGLGGGFGDTQTISKIEKNTEKTAIMTSALVKHFNAEEIANNIEKRYGAKPNATPTASKTPAGGDSSGGGLFGMLGDIVGTIIGALTGGGASSFAGLASLVVKALPGVLLGLTKFLGIAALVTAVFKGIWDGISEYMDSGDLTEAFGQMVGSTIETISFGFIKADKVKKVVVGLVDTIMDTMADWFDNVSDAFDDFLIKPMKKAYDFIANGLKTAIASIFEALASIKLPEVSFKIPALLGGGEMKFGGQSPFAGLGDTAAGLRQSVTDGKDASAAADAADAASRAARDQSKAEDRASRDAARAARVEAKENGTAPKTGSTLLNATVKATTGIEATGPGTAAASKFDTKGAEGFRPNVYDDGAGNPTIGYGHKLTAEELKTGMLTLPDGTQLDIKKGVTRAQADAIYEQDKKTNGNAAMAALEKKGVDTTKLNEATKDALNDLAFNAGPGVFDKSPKLVAALKANDIQAISDELRTTGRTANGQQMGGLVTRANARADQVAASLEPNQIQTASLVDNATTAATPVPTSPVQAGGGNNVNVVQNSTTIASAPLPSTRNDENSYRAGNAAAAGFAA